MNINKELLKEILKSIKDHPQHWNKYIHHQGTTHSFAGFVECKLRGHSFTQEIPDNWNLYNRDNLVQILESNRLGDLDRIKELHKVFEGQQHRVVIIGKHFQYMSNTDALARIALGLTISQADKLFAKHKSISHLERVVKELCGEQDPLTTYN